MLRQLCSMANTIKHKHTTIQSSKAMHRQLFFPASTHWYSIEFRQEYAKSLVVCVCVHLAEFQFCLIVPSLLNSLLCLNQMNLYMLKCCCLMLES